MRKHKITKLRGSKKKKIRDKGPEVVKGTSIANKQRQWSVVPYKVVVEAGMLIGNSVSPVKENGEVIGLALGSNSSRVITP